MVVKRRIWSAGLCDLVDRHHYFEENYWLWLQNTDAAKEPTSTKVMAVDRDSREVPPKCWHISNKLQGLTFHWNIILKHKKCGNIVTKTKYQLKATSTQINVLIYT